MASIYVGFSRPKKFNLFSFLIRIAQGFTPFSHTFMAFEMPNARRLVAFEASHLTTHFSLYAQWVQKNLLVDGFWITVSEEEFLEIFRFCVDNSNKPYSMRNIFGIFFQLIFGKFFSCFRDGNNSFICSELVAKAIKVSNKDSITPKELYDLLRKNYVSSK